MKWLVFPWVYPGNTSVWKNKCASKLNLLAHLVFWDAVSSPWGRLPGGPGGAVVHGSGPWQWSVVVVHGGGPWWWSTAPSHPPPSVPQLSHGKQAHSSCQPPSASLACPSGCSWADVAGICLVKQQKTVPFCRLALSAPSPVQQNRAVAAGLGAALEWQLFCTSLRAYSPPQGITYFYHPW